MNRLRLLAFLTLAPFVMNAGRRKLLHWLLGAHVASDAKVGISIIDASRIELGSGCSIGHFSVIRNLDCLILKNESRIGTFNWIFGARGTRHFAARPERISCLMLGEGASLTSRHIIDCTDRVDIGSFSTIAGFRSQILTHSIDVRSNTQVCAPVEIGAYSFIGTSSIILKGSRFPSRSVLAAGSVYSASDRDEGYIYSGVPAMPVKQLPSDAEYMHRQAPRVF